MQERNTTKQNMIIGIDPGSKKAGCALLQIDGQKQHCLLQTTLNAGPGTLSQRLVSLYLQLKDILSQYHPTAAAIEQVFVKLNPQSALKLGQARGVFLLALAEQQIPIAEYAPRTIKQASVGYGAATKEQVQQMMQRVFKLEQLPATDAADAMAVAMCHANTCAFQLKLTQAQARLSTKTKTQQRTAWI